ncbi:MAG: hypothetical protein Q9Q13_12895 [Acidobacteriota bacterium]|nr:hypothetical protein [Acidobacteriota bacterium]
MTRRRSSFLRAWMLLGAGLLFGGSLPGTFAQQPERPAPLTEEAHEGPGIDVLGPQSLFFAQLHITGDQRVEGDLVCIGCTLILDGPVSGSLVIIGGQARVRASVEGDLIALASTLKVAPGMGVDGDMVTLLTGIEAPDIQVDGSRVNIPSPFPPAGLGGPFSALTSIFGWLAVLHLLIVFVVLMLIAAMVPDRLRLIGDELGPSLGLALLVGFLSHAGIVVIYALLGMSMVGLPLIPVLMFAFVFLRMLGRAGVLYIIGRRIGRSCGWRMSVLGGLAMGFVPYALLSTLPFFFGLPGLAIGLFFSLVLKVFIDWPAMGLALLTSFGSRPRRPPTAHCPPAPPVVE